MADEFIIKQWENYEGDEWWTWAVWVDGDDRALDSIEFVEWTLHPTFPNPIRRIYDRSSKFRLDTGGWGVFRIFARVQLKDGRQEKLSHYLKLHYSDGQQTTA